MLSTRQFKILYQIYSSVDEHGMEAYTIESLAKLYNVTSRTIRNDLEAINNEAVGNGLEMKIIKGKDVNLTITDKIRADQFISQITVEIQNSIIFIDETSRAKYIIESLLITHKKYLKLEQLASELYISQSRLSQDLKNVKKILANYHLTLEQIRGTGIRITGDTINKRKCLMEESTTMIAENVQYIQNHKFRNMIDIAKEIVTDVLINNNYTISDITLQNLIVHVAATTEMLLRNHLLTDNSNLEMNIDTNAKEYNIANQILEKLSKRLVLSYNDNEVAYLAIIIQGKKEYDKDDYVTDELNKFVLKGLKKVKNMFSIDLTNNLDLRISLALHINPLLTRIRLHSQIPNVLTYHIKQNYALPFEIATIFINEVIPKQAKEMTDDELSYLTSHFIVGINELNQTEGNKSALIITKRKKSEVILLQQQLQSRFPTLKKIDISQYYNSATINFDEYDCIIVTEKELAGLHSNCIYINYFINSLIEERRIELSLNGFDVEKDFLSKFHEELFAIDKVKNKNELIHKLYQLASTQDVEESLLESILSHEEECSSYFGNHLAIPHANSPYGDKTFLCVMLLKNPVKWGEFEVDMAILPIFQKDDILQLKIWNYLSFMISNENEIKRLKNCKDFDSFIQHTRRIFKLIMTVDG